MTTTPADGPARPPRAEADVVAEIPLWAELGDELRDEIAAAAEVVRLRGGRILVNSPGSQGVCGLTTGLSPAFTLGCGTFGGNSTTENVTWRHLVNVKRMATNQPSPELQTR